MIYDFFALAYDVASAAATIHRKPAGLESDTKTTKLCRGTCNPHHQISIQNKHSQTEKNANLPSNPFHQTPLQIHHQSDPLFQEATKVLPEQTIRPTMHALQSKNQTTLLSRTSTSAPQAAPILHLGHSHGHNKHIYTSHR
jgi:hypothetical protein